MKGITIRVERVRRGMTQAQLGSMVGFTQTEISKLERGIYEASVKTSAKIRQVFKDIDKGDGDGKENIRDL
jgi:DNA-binding XRE family transcriptional regulator